MYPCDNNANSVLTKYNFVHNTESSEYFYFWSNNHRRVKESMIVFKSADSLKWIYSSPEDSTMSIGFVIGLVS